MASRKQKLSALPEDIASVLDPLDTLGSDAQHLASLFRSIDPEDVPEQALGELAALCTRVARDLADVAVMSNALLERLRRIREIAALTKHAGKEP